MIFTKESYEKTVGNYLMSHTVKETESFIEGMEAMIDIIKNYKEV